MSRNRFGELNSYLQSKAKFLKLKLESFDSWIENGKAEPGGMKESEEGFEILSWQYTGIITIEHLHQDKIMYLIMFIRTWLQDNDDLRELYKLESPRIELIRIDDNYFDIEINCDFVDIINLSQDDNGPIDWISRKWKIDGYDFRIAKSFELKGTIKK